MISQKLKQYWQASPIRKKLSTTFTLMNMVAVLLMLVMLSIGQYFSLKSNLTSNIAVQAQMLSEMIGPALLFDDKDNAVELLSGFKHSQFVLRAEVIRQNGIVYAEYLAPNVEHQDKNIAALPERFDQIRLTYPILVNKKQFATLHVLISLNPVYVNLFWFSAMAMLIIIIALGISFYLGRYILNSISESIIKLTQFVKSIAHQRNYGLRFHDVKSQDEVSDLADGFNLLLNTIESHETSLQKELALRKKAEAEFEQLAMFDNVTGLPNRHHFYQYVQNLIEVSSASKTDFYLMFVDLDDFKMINDTFGHRAGDMLLKTIGERIKASILETGHVFRIGGDEFAVLITEEKSWCQVDTIAQRIINQLNQPVMFEEQKGYVGASIGVCHYPQQADNYIDLLSRADAAMYQAKASDKNCFVHFNHGLAQKIIYAQTLEASLRDALRKQQFLLYYQPIVDLQSLEIQGFEALVRWQHPIYGLISPAEFIPVAEKMGLIGEIGQWVLKTACNQNKVWQDKFHRAFTIAVNISPKQLSRNDFVDQIQSILQGTLMPPTTLHLELTENSLAEDIESAITKMHLINRLGVSLSLDDFGTGFSSLTHLKRLPIQFLKLDKSFIDPLPEDKDAMAIVNAAIVMTNALNIQFIAEGIENINQLKILDKFKGQAQGFLFSPPLPAKEIADLLNSLSTNLCVQIENCSDLHKEHLCEKL